MFPVKVNKKSTLFYYKSIKYNQLYSSNVLSNCQLLSQKYRCCTMARQLISIKIPNDLSIFNELLIYLNLINKEKRKSMLNTDTFFATSIIFSFSFTIILYIFIFFNNQKKKWFSSLKSKPNRFPYLSLSKETIPTELCRTHQMSTEIYYVLNDEKRGHTKDQFKDLENKFVF